MTIGYFIAGTDTNVGKTVVSAWLMLKTGGCYWKPIQSGRGEDGLHDCEVVGRLTECPPERLLPSTYILSQPLSPHAAAAIDGVEISVERIASEFASFVVPHGKPLLVEGAGGLLVPLGKQHFMVDLIKRLGLPVVLVARPSLGTINHTLLSLECLRARDLEVAGVVLSGEVNPANRAAIEKYGNVSIMAEIPRHERLSRKVLLQ